MSEISEAIEYIHKALQESYASQNPEELSNLLIAIAGWRFRLGQVMSEKVANYEMRHMERKTKEGELFVQYKGEGRTNEESRTIAEYEANKEKLAELSALKEMEQAKTLWEDARGAIDTIKYKIKSLLQEKEEV